MTPVMQPIPAEPPIGGPFWTVIVPALLFAVALLATMAVAGALRPGPVDGALLPIKHP